MFISSGNSSLFRFRSRDVENNMIHQLAMKIGVSMASFSKSEIPNNILLTQTSGSIYQQNYVVNVDVRYNWIRSGAWQSLDHQTFTSSYHSEFYESRTVQMFINIILRLNLDHRKRNIVLKQSSKYPESRGRAKLRFCKMWTSRALELFEMFWGVIFRYKGTPQCSARPHLAKS